MKDVKENNKLIAEFMQHPWVKKWADSKYPELNEFPHEKLRYHESWDWIMPVLERASSTGAMYHLGNKSFVNIWVDAEGDFSNDIFGDPFEFITSGESDPVIGKYTNSIECLYLCLVEYIKWYNQQPKDTPES